MKNCNLHELAFAMTYCLQKEKVGKVKVLEPKVAKTKNGRIMLLSKREACASEKLKYINEREASKL